MQQKNQRKELHEVSFLRGMASLMVCLFHLILGNRDLFTSTNWLEQCFQFGYLGVEIFFILSGYVICYSLPDYFSYRQVGTFFKKRIVRIEPPYIVSIFLVLGLNFLSYQITGLSNEVDWLNVLGHFAYLNNFGIGEYINVVYWTLGIEFQFYVILALIFPLILRSKGSLCVVLITFLALSLIKLPGFLDLILPFLCFFAIGILVFAFKIKNQVSRGLFSIFLVAFLLQIYFFHGLAPLFAASFTIAVILFWTYTHPVIQFFSKISFSLYLIHVPIGGKIINLGMRFVGNSEMSRYILVIGALGISIGSAYLFYKFVELPAFRISKRIRYLEKVPTAYARPSQVESTFPTVAKTPVSVNS